jgi:hypothetical protein
LRSVHREELSKIDHGCNRAGQRHHWRLRRSRLRSDAAPTLLPIRRPGPAQGEHTARIQADRDHRNNARQAGLIDWDAIEDRTRNLQSFDAWSDPGEFLTTVADSYREDPWTNQAYRPEVWIEKDALLGVIEGVCGRWRVPYFACRGNNSQSEQYAAGKRFAEHVDLGFIPIVLHLGDHDPNGLDMTRDNRDRLGMFAGIEIEVRRLALNIDQVRQYRPPPNFAKETDTRFAAYEREFGSQCWELDALDPDVISGLVDREIRSLVDMEIWNASMARERGQRAVFAALSENWDDVRALLGSL